MSIPGKQDSATQAEDDQVTGARSAAGIAKSLTALVPKEALIVAGPLLLAAMGAAVLSRRRNHEGAAPVSIPDRVKSASGAHRPRNLVRYYSIGMLINMLERDATRKVLITGLKWARHRA